MELDTIYSLSDRIKISHKFQNRAQQSGSDLFKKGAKTRKILEPGGTPFLYVIFIWLPSVLIILIEITQFLETLYNMEFWLKRVI